MKIAFVLPSITLNGGVRVVAIYADRLKKRGHEVTVIAPPLNPPLRRKVKSLILGRGWPRKRFETSYFDGTGVAPKVLERYRPVTESDLGETDVVVATYYDTAHWVNRFSAARGAKAIFIQNYEVEDGKTNSMLDASWRMPMHKITISKWLVDLARETFGDATVSFVPNSVDLKQFNAAARGKQSVPTVGFVYSQNWLKGCSTSLAAIKWLKAKLPNLRVISFGAEHPSFIKLRLPAYVEFHFRPPQDKLKDLYASCDVWMCGSNREGFHLPPLEAMACRCPVVSTRCGGPLDTIEEGVNGHLVEIGDWRALAARTLNVLNLEPNEWRKMSDAAYHTAVRYTWDDATGLFEKALDLAIKRKSTGELIRV